MKPAQEGWLHKKVSLLHGKEGPPHRMYFRLWGELLAWYDDDSAANQMSPAGDFPMLGVLVLPSSASSTPASRPGLTMTPPGDHSRAGRVIVLESDSSEDLHCWLSVLQAASSNRTSLATSVRPAVILKRDMAAPVLHLPRQPSLRPEQGLAESDLASQLRGAVNEFKAMAPCCGISTRSPRGRHMPREIRPVRAFQPCDERSLSLASC